MSSKPGCKNGLCVSSRSCRHIFQMAAWLFEAEGGKIMHYFPHKNKSKIWKQMCVSQLLFSFLDPLIISQAQVCQICLGRSLTASLENH